ncbi:MAG: hypothetical protein A2X46_11580 [Lentisphaerae bacterium GWF2_57_35]|nr:MAG: hypothetical protein A2X46_11580 [Lentisphaerae bacterium GWF2_57_35]
MHNDSSAGRDQNAMDQWVKNTRLFRQWEDIKQEILLHKWYESEKAGHDIGWERAAVDWMIRHGRNSKP